MKKLSLILIFCTISCAILSSTLKFKSLDEIIPTIQDSSSVSITSNRNSQFLTLENTAGKIITIRRNSDNALVWGERNCVIFENSIKVDLRYNSGVYSITVVDGNKVVGVTINYPSDSKVYLTPKPRINTGIIRGSGMYIKEQY